MGHDLAWVQISDSQDAFQKGSSVLQYLVIAGLIQFALHLVQILNLEIAKRPPQQGDIKYHFF